MPRTPCHCSTPKRGEAQIAQETILRCVNDGGAVHENEITSRIIGAAIAVQRGLGGPGLLESVYEEALAVELRAGGLIVERQRRVALHCHGVLLSQPLRLDMLVEGRVIVECKALSGLRPVFDAQVLTYLRMTRLHVALIINFGAMPVTKGIRRIVNKFER